MLKITYIIKPTKRKKMSKTVLPIILFLLMAPLTHADMFMERAQNAVDTFNSMNKNRGYVFTQKTAGQPGDNNLGYYSVMTTLVDKDLVDLGAYKASYSQSGNESSSQIFRTFCVEPGVITSGMVRGKLSYDNGVSTTATIKDNLSLGTATLYAKFASGKLQDFVDTNSMMSELVHAIRAGMEAGIYNSKLKTTDYSYYTDYDWDSNVFLAALLDINSDKEYWTQDYDPGKYYDEVGDYSVFVMNTWEGDGNNRQNMLYIVENDGHAAATPEPASMLIFGVGITLLPLARRIRKKNQG